MIYGSYVLLSIAGVLLVIAESIAMWRAPQWLARLAFVPLRAERRVPLPPPHRVPAENPGYRDDALVPAARRVPPLHVGRIELSDALLVAARNGTSFGLRRFFLGRRSISRRMVWLVRIDSRIEGDELVFRAKQAVSPLTLPLFLVVGQRAIYGPTGLLGFILMACAAVWVVPFVFLRANRDVAIGEAFAVLDRHARKALPSSEDHPRLQPPSQP